jgi:acyl-CoA synthetase (NDP forming)
MPKRGRSRSTSKRYGIRRGSSLRLSALGTRGRRSLPSLAGSGEVYRGVFRQFGVIEATDIDHWLNCILLADAWPRACGSRFAAVTGSGGYMVMLSDALHEHRIDRAELSLPTLERLRESLPPFVVPRNPLDFTVVGLGSADVSRACLEALDQDPCVDVIMAFLPIPNQLLANGMSEMQEQGAKPAVVVLAHSGQSVPTEFIGTLLRGGIPMLLGTNAALSAIDAYLAAWGRREVLGHRRETYVRHGDRSGLGEMASIIDSVARGVEPASGELEAILERVGIALPTRRRCGSLADVVTAAREIGYPVVLKTDMPEIPHKAELDAVKVGIRDQGELEAAYGAIAAMIAEHFPGATEIYSVQECVESELELLMAMHHDATFGPVMVFGVGGKLVEKLGDVAFRVLPLDDHDVRKMIGQLRFADLFTGFRGGRGVDIDRVVQAVLSFAELAPLVGETFDTIELNPVMASATRVVAVDVLAVRATRASRGVVQGGVRGSLGQVDGG